MNEKFSNKVKSIRLWAMGYLAISVIVVAVLVSFDLMKIVFGGIENQNFYKLPFITLGVVSFILCLWAFASSSYYIKLATKRIEYTADDNDNLCDAGTFMLILLHLLSFVSIACLAFSSHFYYWIVVGIVYIILLVNTARWDLIKDQSEEVDMMEAAPEYFKKSKVIDFNWFVPLGEDAKIWKEIMRKSFLSKLISEQKELIERSKEFGK
jgi:hypothetical protein